MTPFSIGPGFIWLSDNARLADTEKMKNSGLQPKITATFLRLSILYWGIVTAMVSVPVSLLTVSLSRAKWDEIKQHPIACIISVLILTLLTYFLTWIRRFMNEQMTSRSIERRAINREHIPSFGKQANQQNCDGPLRGDKAHLASVTVRVDDQTKHFCTAHLAEYLEMHPNALAAAVSMLLEQNAPDWIPEISHIDGVRACDVVTSVFKPYNGPEGLAEYAAHHIDIDILHRLLDLKA